MRILPFLTGHKILDNNNHWTIYLDFLEILDLILAPSLNKGQIHHLSVSTRDFLNNFHNLYDSLTVKSKSHYVQQYELFGPCQYMAHKHQLLQGLHHTNVNYLPSDNPTFRKILPESLIPTDIGNIYFI